MFIKWVTRREGEEGKFMRALGRHPLKGRKRIEARALTDEVGVCR